MTEKEQHTSRFQPVFTEQIWLREIILRDICSTHRPIFEAERLTIISHQYSGDTHQDLISLEF